MKSAKVREIKTSLQEKAHECRENGYLLSSKRIGTGAFSKVYMGYATPGKICQNQKLANDLMNKKHNMVAIKVISLHHAPPEYSKKFLHREIHALNSTYKHPSVIQLYDMFHTLKRVYLVLELALRGDLLEHINAVSQNKGTLGLSEDEARRIFRQMVSAVKHCHANHIVHRDLKCENILLDEGGYVKLTDFGFANSYRDKNALMSTFCGSVAYTAPEILLSHKYNGEMADLWSLGVILYAMVTGKLPYGEKHPRKLVQLLRKELPFHTPVTSACQDLILALMQWEPSSRLPLDQICRHPWMSPSTADTLTRLRATRSDITGARRTPPPNNFRLWNGSTTAKTSRPCQSGRAMPIPPNSAVTISAKSTTPFTRSTPMLADRGAPSPQRILGGRRAGACSAGARNRCISTKGGGAGESGRGEEVPPAPTPTPTMGTLLESPYRLLMRPTIDQAGGSSNPRKLFVSRPRPPMSPKPFHNLPNFRKSSAVVSSQHQELRERCMTPPNRLPPKLPAQESKRPGRTSMKIPITRF